MSIQDVPQRAFSLPTCLKVFSSFLLLLCVFILWWPKAVCASAAAKILSIRVIDPHEIVIKYSGSEKIKVKYFTLDSSLVGHKRKVFDFQDAELTSSVIQGMHHMPEIQMRVSQFSVKPMITRLVLSGSTSEVSGFDVSQTNNSLGMLSISRLGQGKQQKANESDLPEKKADIKQDSSTLQTPSKEVKQVIQSSGEPGKLSVFGESPTKITLTAPEGQSIKYKTFMLNAPERLVLDLYDWKGNVNDLLLDKIDSPVVIGMRSGSINHASHQITRLVFDLSQKGVNVDDHLSKDKKSLLLSLSVHLADNLKELRNLREGLKIVIDAGHGGYDAGAIHSGVEEKNITLAISKMLEEALASSQIKVVQTRKDDRFVSLEERVNMTVNAKPDLFVSVHCNAMQANTSIQGVESYYFTPQSHELANVLHKHMIKRTKAQNRYVRKARFVVIRETAIPSALIEIGFLSNPTEREKLNSKDYQKTVAVALAEGIIDYLNVQKNSLKDHTAKSKK